MSLVLLSLVLPSLWVTPVKISISGLMYVTGVTVTGVTFLMDNTAKISISGLMYVTGVTFLMDNTTEDQYIRSMYVTGVTVTGVHLPYG